jgi:hypothetical protein
MTQPVQSLRKLPAALLHLAVAPEAEPVLSELASYDDPARGIVQLSPCSWAYLPVAGDPAVFDVAVCWGQRLLGGAALEAAALTPEVRRWSCPARSCAAMRCGSSRSHRSFGRRPPRFAVMLTARAAQSLRSAGGSSERRTRTAGRSVPWCAGSGSSRRAALALSEVLSSRTKFVPGRPRRGAAAAVAGGAGNRRSQTGKPGWSGGSPRAGDDRDLPPSALLRWADLDQQLIRRLGLQDISTAGGATPSGRHPAHRARGPPAAWRGSV